MLLEAKARKRLIKNILDSLADSSKMTRPTAIWLTQNFWLRNNSWPIDSFGHIRPSNDVKQPEEMI